MLYARQTIVNAAGAYGLQAIDLVCVDYQNEQVLLEECQEGREFGFSGKQAIHPDQIDIIQKHFLPAEAGRPGNVDDTWEELTFVVWYRYHQGCTDHELVWALLFQRRRCLWIGWKDVSCLLLFYNRIYWQWNVCMFVWWWIRVDMPVVKWAEKVIGKAKAGGLTLPTIDDKANGEKK